MSVRLSSGLKGVNSPKLLSTRSVNVLEKCKWKTAEPNTDIERKREQRLQKITKNNHHGIWTRVSACVPWQQEG